MKLIMIICLLIGFSITAVLAQDIPTQKVSYQDFGLKKKIKQLLTIYYMSDSVRYEPEKLEVLTFDTQGRITHDYTRIIGKYASETVHQYVYKGNKIDSLNTKASAKNFNIEGKYHYNASGLLDSTVFKGFYVGYTDIFTHNKNGRVVGRQRVYRKNGGAGWTETYHYDSNDLVYVEKKQHKKPALFTYFEGKNELVSFEEGKDTLTFYHTPHGDFKVYYEKITKDKVAEMRQQKIKNPTDFNHKIIDPLVANANYLCAIAANSNVLSGEWVKRYIVDKTFGQNKRNYLFRQYVYDENDKVGSTNYDRMFVSGVESRRLHKMEWK